MTEIFQKFCHVYNISRSLFSEQQKKPKYNV